MKNPKKDKDIPVNFYDASHLKLRNIFIDKCFSCGCESHSHTYYEFEIIVSGNGTTVLNGEKFPITRGSAYITRPTDIHSVMSDDEKPLEVWHFSFMEGAVSEKIIDRILFNASCNYTKLDEETFKEACTLFEIIYREQHNVEHNDVEFLNSCTEVMLTLVLRQMNYYTGEVETDPVVKALKYIGEHFREKITQQDVAKHIGFTTQYKKIGVTYKQYLTRVRISYAKKLMRYGRLGATEACYESGFDSYSVFVNAFSAETGVTPRNYILTHRNK